MPLKHRCDQLRDKRRASLKLHMDHAPKGDSNATHLQRKPTFAPALTLAQTWGWVRSEGLNHLCSIRAPAHKILTYVSAHFNKPKQSPGLSCEGSLKRNKSYGIFPSTWYLSASLTRCCCVHVVQPTAPVRCALSSAQLQCAKRVCCASGEIGAHPCGEAEPMCSWSLTPSDC